MSRTLFVGLIAVLASAACSDARQSTVDSELARDIALANQSPVVPQLMDTALSASKPPAKKPTPPTPAPRKAAPREQPRVTVTRHEVPRPVQPQPAPVAPAPAPAPRFRGLQSGTSFGLATNTAVCTTNLPGDKITAKLTAPVTGENGAYLPEGTTVVLEVASVTPGDKPENAQIALRVRSIVLNDDIISVESADVAVQSELERHAIARDKNSDRRKVVGGAVAGAILGQIMGRDTKSTVIGAAAGAAAGTAAAAASRKYDACLPAGGSVRVTTSQPIHLTA